MSADAVLTELLHDRVRALNEAPVRERQPFVLLWLQGQRRVRQNLAFAHALRRANELRKPLVVYEGLRRDYPHASARLHRFVLDGVADNAADCERLGVAYAFFLDTPDAPRGVLHGLAARAALAVTDWLPAFIHPTQTAAWAQRAPCRVEVVDAAGVAPLAVSQRLEVGARTLRPKLHAVLPRLLRPIPQQRARIEASARFDWSFEPFAPGVADVRRIRAGPTTDRLDAALRAAGVDPSVPPAAGVTGGRAAGLAKLQAFLREGLRGYAEARNEPSADHVSRLSPYLHFGHLGAAEVAVAVQDAGAPRVDREAFLEQLIVRRELSLNFCARWPQGADPFDAVPSWARRTLAEHEADRRPALVDLEALGRAESPDPLWNAAQRQLRAEGRIHGYLRMLWGKSLLLWTRNARDALRYMTVLNDRWALDGRDANSLASFLWCLGLHDRPFPSRPVFGAVRSLSSAATARKFDLTGYVDRWGPR